MASPPTESHFSLLLISFLLLLLAINDAESKSSNFIRTDTVTTTAHKKMQQKLSHLHFYFHDVVSGKNATTVRVANPAKPMPSSPLSAFGMITMMDDLLTEGPDRSSPCVGRAQGMYAGAAQQEVGFLQAMNLYFTSGKYNGSVLTVLGRNAPMNPLREMPVIGGSGLFRFARGYALARTRWLDMGTGDAVVEYNVTVLHY